MWRFEQWSQEVALAQLSNHGDGLIEDQVWIPEC